MADLLFTLAQYGDWGLLGLRLAVGAVFLVHGISKLPMWRMQPSDQMPNGMLATMRFLSIAEPLGAAALILGALTQFAAAGLSVIMLGAIYFKIGVWKNKFVNGWELDLVLLAANIALVLLGAGAWSVDHYFF
jgi:putative oxidoreductase